LRVAAGIDLARSTGKGTEIFLRARNESSFMADGEISAGGGKPSWVKLKKEELEKIVVELAMEGKSPAQIGMILRDKHGVPRAKVLGRKITRILEDKGIDYNDEKKVFEKRVEKLKTHLAKNKHDYPAARSLTKRLWVLKDLSN